MPGTDHPAFAAAESAVRARFEATWRPMELAPGRLPPRARAHHLGALRHGAHPAGTAEGAVRDPRSARGVQEGSCVTGGGDSINQTLEKAGRVDDFFELGMLMCGALEREESCGGHFRAEHQTEEGEALRDDERFAHVAAWEWTGDPIGRDPSIARSWCTRSCTSRRGATSEQRSQRSSRPCPQPDAQGLAPGRSGRGAFRGAPHRRDQRGPRSSSCSTSSTSD